VKASIEGSLDVSFLGVVGGCRESLLGEQWNVVVDDSSLHISSTCKHNGQKQHVAKIRFNTKWAENNGAASTIKTSPMDARGTPPKNGASETYSTYSE
jgi:hypothetical protein